MARPLSIPDERIVEAARDLFLEKGIRVTVEDVARRLGISEGTIFHRFRTKADLFRSAMKPQLEDPQWVSVLAARAGDDDVPAVLLDVGLRAIAYYRQIIPLIMMAWSNPEADGQPPHVKDPNHPSIKALMRVAGYFVAGMRAGRIRRHDPEIVARTFVGGLLHYAWHEVAMQGTDALPMPAETYVRGLVHMLWSGLAPTDKGSPRCGARGANGADS